MKHHGTTRARDEGARTGSGNQGTGQKNGPIPKPRTGIRSGPRARASNQGKTQQAGTTGQALPGLNERMHEFTFVDKAGQRPGTNALFDKVSEDIQDRGIALNA